MWGDKEYYENEILKLIKDNPNKTATQLYIIKPEHIRLSEGTFIVYVSNVRKSNNIEKNYTRTTIYPDIVKAIKDCPGIYGEVLAAHFKRDKKSMRATLDRMIKAGLIRKEKVLGINKYYA